MATSSSTRGYRREFKKHKSSALEAELHTGLNRAKLRSPVTDSLLGLVLSYHHLGLANFGRVVLRRDYSTMETVKIISGGGAGHEPAYTGYVGKGMLTAAIQGEVFKSPPSVDILDTIRELSGKGISKILVIIRNESGVCLNFGLAIERAKNEGIEVRMVIVKDDVDKNAPRKRGLSGIVLLIKIAGAMAEAGMSCDDIYDYLQELQKHLFSASVIMKSCITTANGDCTCTTFRGEKEAIKGIKKCNQLAIEDICLQFIDELKRTDMKQVLFQDQSLPVIVLVNNFGNATRLEELLFTSQILSKLYDMKITVLRLFCGKYLTSLQACGFSLTILRVTDPNITKYLDESTNAPDWIPASPANLSSDMGDKIIAKMKRPENLLIRGPKIPDRTSNTLQVIIQFACEALISCEHTINAMDEEYGDGDTGSNICRGAKAIIKKITTPTSSPITSYPCIMFLEISKIVEMSMAGTLGCLYSIFFEAGAKSFALMKETDAVTVNDWINAMVIANTALAKYTDSKLGDYTMMDPLHACTITMETAIMNGVQGLDALSLGVNAAIDTARGKPPNRKYPDPGAHSVGIWISALCEGLKLRC